MVYFIKIRKWFWDCVIIIRYSWSGGGFYEEGVKVGKWMELSSNNDYHFTHIGEYNKGLRINRWNILFLKSDTDDYKIMYLKKYDS